MSFSVKVTKKCNKNGKGYLPIAQIFLRICFIGCNEEGMPPHHYNVLIFSDYNIHASYPLFGPLKKACMEIDVKTTFIKDDI
jgi:hypothetical protein